MVDKFPTYHIPKIAKIICECGKELYFDIPYGKYRHVGERPSGDRTHKWIKNYDPKDKIKVTYSKNNPNASWSLPK